VAADGQTRASSAASDLSAARTEPAPRFRDRAARHMTGPAVVPPYPSRVDLHTHSRRSDGVLEPRELVSAAAAAGVRVLALADHDTLAGVRELCAAGSPDLPLTLLPGVEINSVAAGIAGLWEGELHILGLGIDPDDETFESVLDRQRRLRATRFAMIVERLRNLGMPVDPSGVASTAEPGSSLGRPQIARLLVQAGYAESVDAAMKEVLARGKPGYVARQGIGPQAAIAAIRGAGGLPVLAHFADAPTRRDLVAELVGFGLGGLEVHYRHFDADTVADMATVAASLHLVPTGGSDYHGDGESYAEAHATIFVPDRDAVSLFEALNRPLAASTFSPISTAAPTAKSGSGVQS
jgi:predicted metal-dependent phosphoesterase TrpH